MRGKRKEPKKMTKRRKEAGGRGGEEEEEEEEKATVMMRVMDEELKFSLFIHADLMKEGKYVQMSASVP